MIAKGKVSLITKSKLLNKSIKLSFLNLTLTQLNQTLRSEVSQRPVVKTLQFSEFSDMLDSFISLIRLELKYLAEWISLCEGMRIKFPHKFTPAGIIVALDKSCKGYIDSLDLFGFIQDYDYGFEMEFADVIMHWLDYNKDTKVSHSDLELVLHSDISVVGSVASDTNSLREEMKNLIGNLNKIECQIPLYDSDIYRLVKIKVAEYFINCILVELQFKNIKIQLNNSVSSCSKACSPKNIFDRLTCKFGYLNLNNTKQFLDISGLRLNDHEIRLLFRKLSTKGNGRVEYNEFYKFLQTEDNAEVQVQSSNRLICDCMLIAINLLKVISVEEKELNAFRQSLMRNYDASKLVVVFHHISNMKDYITISGILNFMHTLKIDLVDELKSLSGESLEPNLIKDLLFDRFSKSAQTAKLFLSDFLFEITNLIE